MTIRNRTLRRSRRLLRRSRRLLLRRSRRRPHRRSRRRLLLLRSRRRLHRRIRRPLRRSRLRLHRRNRQAETMASEQAAGWRRHPRPSVGSLRTSRCRPGAARRIGLPAAPTPARTPIGCGPTGFASAERARSSQRDRIAAAGRARSLALQRPPRVAWPPAPPLASGGAGRGVARPGVAGSSRGAGLLLFLAPLYDKRAGMDGGRRRVQTGEGRRSATANERREPWALCRN